jgi:MFS family permease
VACQTSISIVQWGLGALGPDLARTYGLSAAGLGALISATSFGNAAALVGAGVAVDRFGPRWPLVIGGVATGALLGVGGYAPGVALLGACLLLSGIAGSLISVAGTISVFHGFPSEQRGAALGVRQMSVAAGGLVASFMLPGLAAIGGIGLALAGCGVLTATTAIAFGLASPTGAMHDDDFEGKPIDVGAVLRAPGMLRLLTIGFLLVCSLTTILTFIVPAARASGISTAGAASLFTVVSLSAMAARVVFGRLADRHGGSRRRTTLRDIGLLATVGGLAFWLVSGQGLAIQLPVVAFFAFGALGFNGVLYAIAGELVGPQQAGQAVGLASTVLFGGGALGAIPLGLLADAVGFRALWPAAAALALVGALLSLGLPRPEPQLP